MRALILTAALALLCLAAHPAVADPSPTLSPERVQAAIVELDNLAKSTLRKTGVPGIGVAVVHRDKVIMLNGYGVRELGRTEKIDGNTVFQLASVSKPITTSVLAALVGEQRLDWDDRVIDHDPTFRLYDAWVTRELRLRDLLCHRSGLPDHCGDLLEDMGYDRTEVLRRLRFQPLTGSFRATYAYTNFGFTEAAVAAALSIGKPWDEIADEKLFRPLGMTSSSYRYDNFTKASNRAVLHVEVDGKWTAKNQRQPDAQAPAGGVSSTLVDMTKWLRMLLAEGKFDGRQVVAAEALAETHAPQMVTNYDPVAGRITCYGLGWNVCNERGGRVFWKHSGGFDLGARTEVALWPAEQIGLVVLVNSGPHGVPEGLTETFFDLLIDGKPQRDWIEFANMMSRKDVEHSRSLEVDYRHPSQNPAPAAAPTAYLGTYENPFFGPIEIGSREDGLELRLGPRHEPHVLKHWDRDAFVYQPTGEMAGGPSGVRFLMGPGGTASRVLIENLDVNSQGTFTRISAKD